MSANTAERSLKEAKQPKLWDGAPPSADRRKEEGPSQRENPGTSSRQSQRPQALLSYNCETTSCQDTHFASVIFPNKGCCPQDSDCSNLPPGNHRPLKHMALLLYICLGMVASVLTQDPQQRWRCAVAVHGYLWL